MSTRRDETDAPPTRTELVVPASAVTVSKVGGTVALAAAAAISAQSLISLGHLLGLHGRVAWLLPTSLDVYAATSIWVGYRIPSAHPASAIARRGARLALALSVCCNALYHLLLIAGHQMPAWLTDGLLVLVGGLPPLVAERIFHLQRAVRDGRAEDAAYTQPAASPEADKPATDNAAPAAKNGPTTPTANPAPSPTRTANDNPAPTDNRQPAKTPVAKPAANANTPADNSSVNGTEALVATALPAYRQILAKTGKRPTAPALVAAVEGLNTDSRAKQIREIVEERWHPEMKPRFHLVEADEAERRVS